MGSYAESPDVIRCWRHECKAIATVRTGTGRPLCAEHGLDWMLAKVAEQGLETEGLISKLT